MNGDRFLRENPILVCTHYWLKRQRRPTHSSDPLNTRLARRSNSSGGCVATEILCLETIDGTFVCESLICTCRSQRRHQYVCWATADPIARTVNLTLDCPLRLHGWLEVANLMSSSWGTATKRTPILQYLSRPCRIQSEQVMRLWREENLQKTYG